MASDGVAEIADTRGKSVSAPLRLAVNATVNTGTRAFANAIDPPWKNSSISMEISFSSRDTYDSIELNGRTFIDAELKNKDTRSGMTRVKI